MSGGRNRVLARGQNGGVRLSKGDAGELDGWLGEGDALPGVEGVLAPGPGGGLVGTFGLLDWAPLEGFLKGALISLGRSDIS